MPASDRYLHVLVKAVIAVDFDGPDSGRARQAGGLTALEPVANRPIVHHVFEGLRAAAVGDVVVVGDAGTLIQVRRSFEGYRTRSERPDYALSTGPAGLGATLRSVAPVIGDSPCLFQPGDGLLGESIPPLTGLLPRSSPDLTLFVSPEGTRAGLDIGVFGEGALMRASELIEPGEAADLATVADRLAAAGGTVAVRVVESWQRYRGHGADLLELNRLALDRLMPDVSPELRSGNRIEGRVFIHPTASATSSVIVGPTIIGAGASLADAYIGPYTSVGAGARIEGAEIERSIVSPGASLMHVGGRLVSSLVGRDARVFRDFSLPRAIRLRVGAGDEVALC